MRHDVQKKEETNPEQTVSGKAVPIIFILPPKDRHQLICGCSFRAEKELWIRQKYVDKRFVKNTISDGKSRPSLAHAAQLSSLTLTPGSGQDQDVGLCLYQAALAGDLVTMAAALAQGAEVNRSFSREGGRTALIAAAVGVRYDQLDASRPLIQIGFS